MTVPVGVTPEPVIVPVTVRAGWVLIEVADGVTVTVGVSRFTVTVVVPAPDAYTVSPL
jgi:hypothetical protein